MQAFGETMTQQLIPMYMSDWIENLNANLKEMRRILKD